MHDVLRESDLGRLLHSSSLHLVVRDRFELPTPWASTKRSTRLSYRTITRQGPALPQDAPHLGILNRVPLCRRMLPIQVTYI